MVTNQAVFAIMYCAAADKHMDVAERELICVVSRFNCATE